MKIKTIITSVLLLLLCVCLSGCGNSGTKEFEENVDKFCESYDKNVISDDPLYKDIGFKNCVSALAKMAELYEDSGLQKSYNDHMRRRISYSVIEPVLEYDEEDGDIRILRGQLVDYLKGND